ncbi:MAG: DUF262 domain-containing protein [Gammaproteobacteria bacterium]|nr:DUF262 domain-containing protein [Gammaproteobacteria bacterium]MBU1653598.1 DUF262 domain-containing protein [Gammaproteobacteria bacterium]MBU1959718.1 DUF262 domain-containing protein [Gammaproteobacteria bacterium]
METVQNRIPEVKPEVVFVFELLNQVRSGKLRIPRFQRSYVWSRQQMTELLDSINRQYPIGSLLVWETDERVSSRRWVGPVAIPPLPQSVGGAMAHVLDGQQRLSTLTGVLMAPAEAAVGNDDDEDPDRWNVWYNIEINNFEHLRPEEAKQKPHLFPMWRLLDTVSFLDESERILKNAQKDKGHQYVGAIRDLLQRFQSYKVPVIRIKDTGLNQAVEIFARLNSRGKKVTADEMVSALSYREDPTGESTRTLSEHIKDILEELDSHGFGGINPVIVLRALLATMDEDIYRTDWARLKDEKISGLRDRLPAVVSQTQEALVRAALFLHDLGVYNHRVLPYSMQLVALGAFFGACPDPSPGQREFLTRWFWVSSFTGWFASGNPSRVGLLLKELKDKVAHIPDPGVLETMRLDEAAQPFPKTFDMRSARVRALLLVLLNQYPRSQDGTPLPAPWREVQEHGPLAIGYIAATVQDRILKSSPANRILKIDPKDRSQAKNWLVSLEASEQTDLILASHAIPKNALSALRENNADGFLRSRLEYLIDLEREFMKARQVTPPPSREVRAPAIDTDEIE